MKKTIHNSSMDEIAGDEELFNAYVKEHGPSQLKELHLNVSAITQARREYERRGMNMMINSLFA